ncbi:T9SS type A sorting domain-containing protein [Aquimarina muelleri]|uniref:Secretion system C-terminal sorting domain-containing protein n=1 Tax=Aquimarina muelleri TaxID=279356 RepID=A0A918N541_9FLAO|nr:T9SS type A sorting domain-containing protein [Aquimarina muelleri]MCX2764885.1 T9SS type A sorting domain-containing protein [Aquimarina muelleri]GGX34476.1 hypothetical protein GCM10007384_38860 [Aquimarina muelleri]
MKTIVFSVAFSFIVSLGFSQFQRTFGTDKSEMGKSLTQLNKVEKGYVIAGYTTQNFIGNVDATLVKTDLNGNQIWSRVYGGEKHEYFNSVRQSTYFSPNNKVAYVAAGITQSFGFGAGDAYLTGVDVNGAPVFSVVYGGKEYDEAHCVQNIREVTGKSGYILVGDTRSYSQAYPGTNIYVAKTDLMGNLVKATVIGGRGDQRGLWIEQTKDGGYIITGSTTNYWCGATSTLANPPTDIFVIKLKSDLTLEWNRILGYPKELDPSNRYLNVGTCVKQTKDGNYVLTGYTNSFGINNSFDAFLLFLKSNGSFIGMKTYGTERTEYGHGIEETFTTAGTPLYTIVGQQTITSPKAMMFQTDAGGNLLWARNYGRNGNEGGMEMTIDNFDKGFAFTGYTTSFGAGATEIYLVETTNTGKTDTSCERQIDLKEKKEEPCVTRSVQQIFVKEYRKIDPKAVRVEYKEDGCGKGVGAKTEEVKTVENKEDIALYPNPVHNHLYISVQKSLQITEIKVFDLQGKEVLQNIKIQNKGSVVVNTNFLSKGVYVVKLKTKNGEMHIKRFFKN